MEMYDDLAEEVRQAVRLAAGAQYWIGLAGAPGSGKSTLAGELVGRLGDLMTVIPMDGYHYYRRTLDVMDDPAAAHARRGAPHTFDGARFVEDLLRARAVGHGRFPSFDHGVGDPVEDDIVLTHETAVVLVEGNYLLLATDPWSRLRDEVFDETWFLDVPLAECKRRVHARHLETGLSDSAARERVETNDGPNADLVINESRGRAGRLIRECEDREDLRRAE